jgi:hypothetical protein
MGFEPFELGLDDTEAEEPAEDPGAQIDRAEELREKWMCIRASYGSLESIG